MGTMEHSRRSCPAGPVQVLFGWAAYPSSQMPSCLIGRVRSLSDLKQRKPQSQLMRCFCAYPACRRDSENPERWRKSALCAYRLRATVRWLRRQDSNLRPQGYGPCELPTALPRLVPPRRRAVIPITKGGLFDRLFSDYNNITFSCNILQHL